MPIKNLKVKELTDHDQATSINIIYIMFFCSDTHLGRGHAVKLHLHSDAIQLIL